MKLKKNICFCCLMGILIAGVPIKTYAFSFEQMANESISTQGEFEKIIEIIVSIKTESPDASEAEILEKVNIAIEKQRGVIDTWNALTDSEKRLVIRYPFDALQVNKAKDIAISKTEDMFGYNGLGDRSDAFRHGIWNAEMTILIGSTKAELFATAHEDKDTTGSEDDGFSKEEHKYMDLHNNAVGRNIGQQNMSATENELAEIIFNDITSEISGFIWLHE